MKQTKMQTSAYDLGIFTQVVESYSRLRLPISDIKGPGYDILGDHFSPILVLVAPIYRVFPDPITLLVVQSALLAISGVPITNLAIDRCGRPWGILIGIAYGLSFGIQQAASFDFHEVAFAVPLIVVCMTFLARKRWLAAALSSLPLFLVKEDQALIVLAVGAYIFFRGPRRLGAALSIAALVVGATTVFLVIPAFNQDHTYAYLSAAGPTNHGVLTGLYLPPEKIGLLVALTAPTIFLSLASPMVLMVMPSLILRLWATNPGYWATDLHYNCVLMPILFVAFLDALHNLSSRPSVLKTRVVEFVHTSGITRRIPRSKELQWQSLTRAFSACGVLAVAVATTLTSHPLRCLIQPGFWRVEPDLADARATLETIPQGAEVSAANKLAPQLVTHHTVLMFPDEPTADIHPEWVAVKAVPDDWPVPAADQLAAIQRLPSLGYVEFARGGGVVVYRHSLDSGTRPDN
ncbi:DUF2079 domain-containing protein [Plantactinospora sp. KBS50]|uniref:DUF2079 domain-containing protein n=1 Tax=Plantactinospora sp. KBS50 TaxID=2024580 RepID=UPI0012FE1575|nr:DUF2079 domain-containing protein [Plantactinospora sp. KBS50]